MKHYVRTGNEFNSMAEVKEFEELLSNIGGLASFTWTMEDLDEGRVGYSVVAVFYIDEDSPIGWRKKIDNATYYGEIVIKMEKQWGRDGAVMFDNSKEDDWQLLDGDPEWAHTPTGEWIRNHDS